VVVVEVEVEVVKVNLVSVVEVDGTSGFSVVEGVKVFVKLGLASGCSSRVVPVEVVVVVVVPVVVVVVPVGGTV